MATTLFGKRIFDFLTKMGLEFYAENNDCNNSIGQDLWIDCPKGYEVNDCGEWLATAHYTDFKNLTSPYNEIKYDFTHLRKEINHE